jgi:hypothetical protein
MVKKKNKSKEIQGINLLKQLRQLSSNRITNLNSCRFSTNITSSDTCFSDVSNRLFNYTRLGLAAKRVLKQHSHRQDSSDRVHDALSGNIGGRTVDRLIDTINLALAVGDTSQTGTWQQTQRTGDNASLVGNNITKQVASDNDSVELAGVLDHEHSSGVDQVVTKLQLREFVGDNLCHDFAPQSACGEHIGLVQTPDGEGRVVLEGKVGGEASDALNLGTRVGFCVESEAVAVVFLAVTEVDSTGQFTDDVEVDATAYFGFEWGDVDKRGCGETAWPKVAKGAQLFAEFEDSLFGTDGTMTPFLTGLSVCSLLLFLFLFSPSPRLSGLSRLTYRSSDGSKDNRISVLSSGQSSIGQWLAMSVYRSLHSTNR